MTIITGSPSALDDDALLERVNRNDADAYRILVERHIDKAYALALRILKNAADAEDVAQDAFIKTWQNRHKWEIGRAKFSTWLYRVIVNRCIDLQRSPRGEWIEHIPEPCDDREDAVAAIGRQEVYKKLGDALGGLPDQQRIAVALCYYDYLSNAEIADVMGTSVSAVESLLKRGRQFLRTAMKRSGAEVMAVLADRP
jgi:RNA polymerase sigma-70 factor (ECF subfamily)